MVRGVTPFAIAAGIAAALWIRATGAPGDTLTWTCFTAAAGIFSEGGCGSPHTTAQTGRTSAAAVSAAPAALTQSVSGTAVTLAWTAPSSGDPATSYVVEAGSASALSNLASFDTNSAATSLTVASVPAGTYFVRVRGRNASGVSAASNEVVVTVSGGSVPCAGAPNAPTGLSGSASGSTVTLSWTAPSGGCSAASYTIEAGSSAGGSNLANFNTGSTATSFSASSVPTGTYYVRVRARGASGLASTPSNEALVVVTGAAPGQWVSIGPSALIRQQFPSLSCANSGRVADIAVDPGDPTHWLNGAGNGGVWETRDSGTSWTPLTDTAPTLATGAVAFAPSNPGIIYVGTGEAAHDNGFQKAGVGLLKSIDGGRNWTLLAQSIFNRASIMRVRVHPTNPDVVLAIAMRGGFGRESTEFAPSPPPFGVLKSTNGGVTWDRKLAGQATALVMDPTNFNNQYAAIGDQFPGLLNVPTGTATNGLYRSPDGGETWTLVSGPWGTVNSTTMSTVGRIELALAPSNPSVLYVSIQIPPNGGSTQTGLLGLYRTDNAWASTPTWITIPTDATGPGGYCGPGKCGYTHIISVDPGDANRLFAGGGEQGYWRCSNCGPAPTWTDVRGLCTHSDYQAAAWAGNRLIVGNDGGVWSTLDFGANWRSHNAALPTAMFYSGALHPTDPEFVLGGIRDFPLSYRRTGTVWSVLLNPGTGGEWGEAEVAISSSHPDTDWMGAWIFGFITRTTNGGRSGVVADGGIDKTGASFVPPVRKCPTNDDVFLTGTNRLWRTNNFFSSVAPSWTANGPADPFSILSIAYVPSNANCNAYAYGTSRGKIQITRNGGASWTDLDASRTLPARPVNGLAFDPSNANILYVGLSSFDIGTPGTPGHVFKTTNALSSSPAWTNISPPIDVPFDVIAVDPRNPLLVYAGCDTGLWHSVDGGASWVRDGLNVGLPPAPVYDIQINPTINRTVVFTYGRGAYELAR